MFSEDQKRQLAAPLSRENVKSRAQSGRQLSYIEGWHAIAEANRIFGFDGWTRETVELRCVNERERKLSSGADAWGVTYVARVRISVGDVIRDGCGAGHGIDRDLGQAHESAIKEAETDAMKRALMTFGNPFGLALYDKEQANVSDTGSEELESKRMFIEACRKRIANPAYTDQQIRTWWQGEEAKNDRRVHDLSQAEVDELKNLIIHRGKKAA